MLSSKFNRHKNISSSWPYLPTFRLKEIIYSQDQLYLAFEYLEFDLKKYMKTQGNQPLPKEQA